MSTPTIEPVVGAPGHRLARPGSGDPIIAVVLVHAVAPAVNGTWVAEGGATWWIANVTDSAGRWCVPVFVMVSGALLLDPRRVERSREFYRRRLARIGVPLVVWALVYVAYHRWWLDEPLTADEAGRDVLAGTPFLQLSFLYVFAGLYRRDGSRSAVFSGVTFGIFLVHPLVLYPVQERWPLPDAPAAFIARLAAHLVITLAGSLAVTVILRRIPYVRAAVG